MTERMDITQMKVRDLAQCIPQVITIYNLGKVIENNMNKIKEISREGEYNSKYFFSKELMKNFCHTPGLTENDEKVIYDMLIFSREYHLFQSIRKYNVTQGLFIRNSKLQQRIEWHKKSAEYLSFKKEEIIFNSPKGPFQQYAEQERGLKGSTFILKDGTILLVEEVFCSSEFLNWIYHNIDFEEIELHIYPFIESMKKQGYYSEKGAMRPLPKELFNRFTLDRKKHYGNYFTYHFQNSDSFFQNEEMKRLYSVGSGISRYKNNIIDFIVTKRNETEMSMMIELLILDESTNILMGHCIHCDVLNATNENLYLSTLQHIDFALNIYQGKTIEERLNEVNMLVNNGKVKADKRTHFLKIEEISFLHLPNLIYLYFDFNKDPYLMYELIYSLFGESDFFRKEEFKNGK